MSLSLPHRLLYGLATLLVAAGLAAAQTTQPATSRPDAGAGPNPAAEGFDHEGSDPEAIAVADRVMEALGGRAAWDTARHLAWDFLGREYHVWDKHTGRIRIEFESPQGADIVVLMNVDTMEGEVWRDRERVEDPQVLEAMLRQGRAKWINAGYWMFMPYKLKDTGVTLKHVGERTMRDGRDADVLELTFADVGVTPNNKYHVYVAKDTNLVEQWDFFADASRDIPMFSTPWENWRSYGGIMLSDSRGEGRTMYDVGVHDELADHVYDSPGPSGLPHTIRKRRGEFRMAMNRLQPFVGEWRSALMVNMPDGTPRPVGLFWNAERAFNDSVLKIEMHQESRGVTLVDPEWTWVIFLTYDVEAQEYVATHVTPYIELEDHTRTDSRWVYRETGNFNDDGQLIFSSTRVNRDTGEEVEFRSVWHWRDEYSYTVTDYRRTESGQWKPALSHLVKRPRTVDPSLRPAPAEDAAEEDGEAAPNQGD